MGGAPMLFGNHQEFENRQGLLLDFLGFLQKV